MVNWSTVTLPKDRGGLGPYQMQYKNQAILAKLCWRLANESEAPREKMLAKKYLTTRRLTEEGTNLPCSRIWAACKKWSYLCQRTEMVSEKWAAHQSLECFLAL